MSADRWAEAGRHLEDLAGRASALGGRLAVVVHDLTAGRRLTVAPDEVFTSASLIKVPLMVATLERVETGSLSLKTPISTVGRGPVGGSGILSDFADLTSVSVRDLLMLCITISDNLATNLLIDTVGMDAVNASVARAGLAGTALRRRMMDLEARQAGRENQTTAADMALLLEKIAAGRDLFADPSSYGIALDFLTGQKVNDRLPKHLPADLILGHKTGELDGIKHDAGIVLRDDQPILVVAALTEGFPRTNEGEETAADLVAEAGRIAYTACGSDGS